MQPRTIGNPERERVVAKATFRAAELLGLSGRDLSGIIGLSEPTLSRLRKGGEAVRLAGKPYELALLFVRLYRALDAIAGGDDLVSRRWLRNENAALGGRPIDRIRSIDGLAHVLAYLDARRAPL